MVKQVEACNKQLWTVRLSKPMDSSKAGYVELSLHDSNNGSKVLFAFSEDSVWSTSLKIDEQSVSMLLSASCVIQRLMNERQRERYNTWQPFIIRIWCHVKPTSRCQSKITGQPSANYLSSCHFTGSVEVGFWLIKDLFINNLQVINRVFIHNNQYSRNDECICNNQCICNDRCIMNSVYEIMNFIYVGEFICSGHFGFSSHIVILSLHV